jgi:hypothetical protein
MKTLRNILFGVIYTGIYSFLAIMSTGGGHGNFFLFVPITTCILVLIALFLLTRLEGFTARLFFVVLMLMHYIVTFLLLLDIRDSIAEDFNRVAGLGSIFVTSGTYLIGQLIIWIAFFKSVKTHTELQ